MKRFAFLIFLIFTAISCSSLNNKDTNLFHGRWQEEATPNKSYIQGFELRPDGTASSIGMATLKYEAWAIKGTDLILSGKSIGNGQTIDFSDEWQIIEISPSHLRLQNNNGYQLNYYRE